MNTPDFSMAAPFAMLAFMFMLFVWMVLITISQAKQKKWGQFAFAVGMDAFALMMVVDCIGIMVTGSAYGWFR